MTNLNLCRGQALTPEQDGAPAISQDWARFLTGPGEGPLQGLTGKGTELPNGHPDLALRCVRPDGDRWAMGRRSV